VSETLKATPPAAGARLFSVYWVRASILIGGVLNYRKGFSIAWLEKESKEGRPMKGNQEKEIRRTPEDILHIQTS
jgi:hypothetical protein